MDLALDRLSLSKIEMLRQVESLDHRKRGFMPSKGKIQHYQNALSKHANRILPFNEDETKTGECVKFYMNRLLSFVARM